jgi:hypothetical protein
MYGTYQKMPKNRTSVISSFFGSKTPYKKQDDKQNLCMEDLVLFTTKGYIPLNIGENLWMCRLTLNLDPKLVFPSHKTL